VLVGVGCVYGYDAVGSFERSKYMTEGSGVSLIQPLLDNQVRDVFCCHVEGWAVV
jgi:20S proteasome alpha/beta subunit